MKDAFTIALALLLYCILAIVFLAFIKVIILTMIIVIIVSAILAPLVAIWFLIMGLFGILFKEFHEDKNMTEIINENS